MFDEVSEKMDTEKNILRGPESTVTFPADLTMGQFLLNRLADYGDQVALIHGATNKELKFSQILDDSRRLAVYLSSVGLKKNDKIAVCSENSLNYVIPVCSILYLGATCCPLNPSYTPKEFMHALTISKPLYIFASETATKFLVKLVKKLPWVPKLISMGELKIDDVHRMSDVISSTIVSNPEEFEACKVNVDQHLVAIMCSSGTTGLPKGVMLTDKNFLTITRNYMEMGTELTKDLTTLILLPLFHCYGFTILLNQILFGATAVMLQRFEPEIFLSAIEKYKIRSLLLVPPILVFLAKSPLVDRYDLSSLERIWSGAAPLSSKIEKALQKRLNVSEIKQGYGLTETTLTVLTNIGTSKPGSIGTLSWNAFGKVIPVDGGEPLGPRQEGELCFKGEQIMKGYCGDAISTSATIDKDGWLHTGDVGYYDEDGYFYIVDRLKELIKYKGFQVPPAELEAILLTHPEVEDAAVVGLPDEMAGELPMAFVVKKPGSRVSSKDIIEYVDARVSSQKRLRGGVRFIESIPKNPSGKILRKLLRDKLKSKL